MANPRSSTPTAAAQFTSMAFTDALNSLGMAVSMDKRGAWRDRVFAERLWRAIKYEGVCLHVYESVSDASQRIGRFIEFYNAGRPDYSLGKKTPDEFYFASLPAIQQSA